MRLLAFCFPPPARLFVSSEVSWPTTAADGSANPVLARAACDGTAPNGVLTVIDVRQLEKDASTAVAAVAAVHSTKVPVLVDAAILGTTSLPSALVFGTTAIRANIAAGCSPVRLVQTNDSKQPILWLNARGDDRVLAFDDETSLMLETSADLRGRAFRGYAPSGGPAPVGLALFGHDRFLAVANSNRFASGAPGQVTILRLTANARGNVTAKSVATLDGSGLFPREITLSASGSTLYVTNYSSQDFLA